MFEANRYNFPTIQQHRGVVEFAVLTQRRPYQHGGTAISCLSCQCFYLALHRVADDGPENQVFRRITTDHQFAGDHQVGAGFRRTGSGLTQFFDVTGDISNDRV